ncbi:MAG: hydrogenase, partial [Rhodothermales bacterium]
DLLFIGGGIGLAPLRSLIEHCIRHRERFGHMHIVYGAASPKDLVFKRELFEVWPQQADLRVDVTVDAADEGWDGPVGFVPPFLEELDPTPAGKIAITCGPPIMIRFVIQTLTKMGYARDAIITTLEKRMKCGIGKCGRCNIGSTYVCLDGPVFSLDELDELPQEY